MLPPIFSPATASPELPTMILEVAPGERLRIGKLVICPEVTCSSEASMRLQHPLLMRMLRFWVGMFLTE
jgi:hypothetical protein